MRLPTSSSTVEASSSSPSSLLRAAARLRQRVPAMKQHQRYEEVKEFVGEKKIGQVQDDQSRTKNDDDHEGNYTDNFISMRMRGTVEDSFIIGSTQRIGVRHARDLLVTVGDDENEKKKSKFLMTSETRETMPTVVPNHRNNDNQKSNSQKYFVNEEEEDSPFAEESSGCKNTMKIMSGEQPLPLSATLNMRGFLYGNERDEGMKLCWTTESSLSTSCSQINSSSHLKKVKRTMWWSGGHYRHNSLYGYVCYYATLCIFLWMMASSTWIQPATAITARSGERGDKSPFITGSSSHHLSERSAAIVKLERDYQPIIFPKKESQSHLEDNHLHSQNPQLTYDDQDEIDNFNESGSVSDGEKILSDPTDIPESSRSTIIFRGVRNRTRVEVGPVNLFTTKRKSSSNESGSNRKGRVMFSKSEALNERDGNSTVPASALRKLTTADLSQSSEEGSSRKASPDVQDIIDGIVKLLGGKVHHPQPGSPVGAANPHPQVPLSQKQPPQSPAYNLFNPNKPIYYQTAKPSRINSRGPPLPGGGGVNPANNNAAGSQTQFNNNQQQQFTSAQNQNSFEAIPLEALNSDFKLNQTSFGPPFLLSQVVVSPEAPYKQGVPLPEQLVPTISNKDNNNGNFNLRQPSSASPTVSTSFVTSDKTNNGNRAGSIFFPNGNNRYNNNDNLQRPNGGHPNLNGNAGLTVSTSLTTAPNTHITHYNHHQQHNNQQPYHQHFNENGTRNPYYSSSSTNLNGESGEADKRKPFATISSFSEGSEGGNVNNPNPPLTTISPNVYDKNPVENHRALGTPRPPPLSLTLPTGPEDDEEDDLRFTTNVDFDIGGGQNGGIKWNQDPTPGLIGNGRPDSNTSPPINLEPTITEDSQLPSWSSTDSGRVGSNKETIFDFSEINKSVTSVGLSNGAIRPTSANSLYPTLVLETNSENGLVEIVTKLASPPGASAVDQAHQHVIPVSPTSTQQNNHQLSLNTEGPFGSAAMPINHQQPHPDSNLRKQVQHFNSLLSTRQTPSPNGDNSKLNTQSIHSLPTPPLRPGIVINEGPASSDPPKGYGSVEVVTVNENGGKVGDIFDVTVTAKQSFGGKHTGQAFSVDSKDDLVITHPTGTEQFVSIDGKRTYFSLHPNTPTAIGANSATKAVGQVLPVENTEFVNVEVAKNPKLPMSILNKPKPNQNIGVGSVGNPVPLLPQPPGKTLFGMGTGSGASAPGRAVSTSLSISGSGGGSSMSMTGPSGKPLPNLIRRPLTRRPSIPPVRIDTCIVGDDTTCNSEQGEVCRTDTGVSSCVCRSGYARRRHREQCKAIVSLVMSIKLDKLNDKKLSYNPDYFNPNSELYQTIEWETIHAMDSCLGETTLSSVYVGSKLEAIGFDGRHAVVNTTVLLQENPKQQVAQVKKDLQKQMIQVLTRNRNNFGKSQLWVEGPISAVAAITDYDECESPDTNDCDTKAHCVNTLGSFECRCEPGYGDQFEKDKRRSGRKCESCNGKTYCNGRGECLIEKGQKVCKCAGNYYGSQCDIDGEVLAVAIGASVSAVVIIGLTLACLCMWSRKWKREEQKAALMSRTLFGGMATQALSYLGKNNSNPYQQHLSMDDRLRWAQAQDVSMGGNIYVQNDPMSMHTSPQLIGTSMMETPPLMSARRSAETVDTTVDELFDERQCQTKRPRSRASPMQGSLYYDLEPEPKNDIYATRSMVQFPAQFCVPMGPMSHYAHAPPPNRGYFP